MTYFIEGVIAGFVVGGVAAFYAFTLAAAKVAKIIAHEEETRQELRSR